MYKQRILGVYTYIYSPKNEFLCYRLSAHSIFPDILWEGWMCGQIQWKMRSHNSINTEQCLYTECQDNPEREMKIGISRNWARRRVHVRSTAISSKGLSPLPTSVMRTPVTRPALGVGLESSVRCRSFWRDWRLSLSFYFLLTVSLILSPRFLMLSIMPWKPPRWVNSADPRWAAHWPVICIISRQILQVQWI